METTRKSQSLEREVLGALCVGGLPPDQRERILAPFTNYEWQSPDHRVLFVALRRARQQGGADLTALREFLVAEVTRLGFPDFDLASFFASPPLASEEMARLVDALVGSRRSPVTK
jgi:hypothetical protein